MADCPIIDIYILSPASLDFPKQPSEYAAHAIPSLNDFQALWNAWDIVSKAMVPRQELLSKPINLRNALVFYLGHIPTFLDIHLTRALRGKPTEPEAYQQVFERGIDPDVEDPEKCHSHSEIPDEWPPLAEILDYQQRVRDRVRAICQSEKLSRRLGKALFIGFEHEAMHLETFLYMLLQSEKTLPPPGVGRPDFAGIFHNARRIEKANQWFIIPEQTVTIGLDDPGDKIPDVSFGWDNEKPRRTTGVHSFVAKARPVTNGEYAQYMKVNPRKNNPASWVSLHPDGELDENASRLSSRSFLSRFAVRTMFGPVPLELAQDWPVIASYDELAAYAEWNECRLPTFEEARSIYQYVEGLKRKESQSALNGHGHGLV